MKRSGRSCVRSILIVGLIIAALSIGYYYVRNQNQPVKTVTNKAFITEIRKNTGSESCTLYVTWDEIHDAIIPVSAATKIYDVNGKRITGDQLREGDLIEVLAENAVFYEPVDTFYKCYRIKVLPEDPTILQEVHVYSKEDYGRKYLGTLSAQEAAYLIDLVSKGEWFIGNIKYRQDRLKVKIAGNILYYYAQENAFYNEKTFEILRLNQGDGEKTDIILRTFLELQEKGVTK